MTANLLKALFEVLRLRVTLPFTARCSAERWYAICCPQWSNYKGACPPLKARVAPSKHLVLEDTRGPLKGPLKSPVKFNT